MVSKLKMLLPLVCLLASSTAYALGLGDINLKSSLNQPLLAEIEILQEENLSPGEILPTLAAVADFKRAGVQREFFLSNLDFKLVSAGGKQLVLVVSTKESVQEPFLNFLIEVNWPTGRILKEFTILLDPPLYDNTQVLELNDFTTETSSETVVETIVEETVVVPVTRVEENLPANQYRVKRNDTMWEIAVKLRPVQGVSPQQIMLAIQDVNPNAFIQGNINRVKEGSVLSIPSVDDINRWGQLEASNEVNRQYQAFKNPSSSATTAAAVSAASSTTSALSDGSEQDPEGYLELVSSGDQESGDLTTGEKTDSAIEQELSRSLELNDQFERENSELESRLADLQEQLDLLQNLVNLQSDTGVILANQDALTEETIEQPIVIEDSAEEVVEESIDLTAVEASETEITEETNLSRLLASDSESILSESESTEITVVEDAISTEITPVIEPEPVEAEAAPVEPVEPVEPVVAVQPIQNFEAPVQESFVSYMINDMKSLLFGNPMYTLVGGLVFIILLLLMLNTIIKRRAVGDQEDDFEDDILDLDGIDDEDFERDDESTTDFESEVDPFSSHEESFEGEEASGSASSDSVAEADIYIAYGRYDQAEELLKNALAEDSSNEEAKLKLAEVYVETGNADGFSQIETSLAGASVVAQQALAELKSQMSSESPELPVNRPDSNFLPDDLDDLESTSNGDFEPPVLSSIDQNEGDDLGIEVSDELSFGEVSANISLDEDLTLDEDDGMSASEDLAIDLDTDTDTALDSMIDEHLSSDDLEFSISDFSDSEGENDVSENTADAGLDSGIAFETTLAEETDVPLVEDVSSESDFGDLSFDFDTGAKEDPLAALDKQIAALSDTGSDETDGDLGGLDLDLSGDLEDINFGATDSDSSDSIEGLDFSESDIPLSALDSSNDYDVEFNIEGLESEIADETVESVAELSSDDSFDLGDLGDLETDMDAMTSDDEFDLLGGTDEASTKLDLARAYIDMEEKEGAKEILEEVVKEGNPEQIQKAQELLTQIG